MSRQASDAYKLVAIPNVAASPSRIGPLKAREPIGASIARSLQAYLGYANIQLRCPTRFKTFLAQLIGPAPR